tara:strand:- start:87 stop:590 length:504 start_codon:yes stop_codon:yes gene_type:complete
MLVSEMMTTRVVWIDMDSTLEDVGRMFRQHPFHHLVVMEATKVVGVITEHDMLEHVSPFIGKMAERTQDVASLKRRVHQMMTRELVTTSPEATVAEACETMLNAGVSCLPVVNASKALLGIVTLRDFARLAGVLLRKAEDAGEEPIASDASIELADEPGEDGGLSAA